MILVDLRLFSFKAAFASGSEAKTDFVPTQGFNFRKSLLCFSSIALWRGENLDRNRIEVLLFPKLQLLPGLLGIRKALEVSLIIGT